MAEDWVLDTGLAVLIADVLAQPGCTVRRSEIGTIGDPAHQARESKHNPEHPPPPGNPDNEVDAADFPHAPARGLDCGTLTESLRLSRDPRLYLVIFNGRQFSSYARDGIAPFTWRPYSGDDMHREHAHVEVNDTHHGDTSHWKVTTMADISLNSKYRAWVDLDGNGKVDTNETQYALYQFIVAAHAEAWKAAAGVALIEERVDRLAEKVDKLIEAVKASPALSDEQLAKLGEVIVAGLSAELTVKFVPKGTAE